MNNVPPQPANALPAHMQYMEQRKTPGIAVLLSFFITGAGQIYNGEVGKGIGMIVGYVFCLMLGFLILPLFILFGLWIWGMIDAHDKAIKFNEALQARMATAESTAHEAAEHLKSTTVRSEDFVSQVDKSFKLFQSSLLSQAEFEGKKEGLIQALGSKKLVESPEDFLTALIPLIQKNAISEHEAAKIKALIF